MQMITASEIYWITRCDSVTILLGVMCGVFMGGGLLGVWVCAELRNISIRNLILPILSFIFGLWCGILNAFIPSTREAAAIYLLPRIVNSDTVQAHCKELYELTKDWVKSLTTKKE